MKRLLCVTALCFLLVSGTASAASFQKDVIATSLGDLEIIFIGHGTLILQLAGKTIHVDPYGKLADYASLPKADLILITHDHGDHLDNSAINQIKNDYTKIILSVNAALKYGSGQGMMNNESTIWENIIIKAVPAYNLVHRRDNGDFFHPKGQGNGYILTIGDKRLYIAGDTENTPEMKALTNIDIAFLPMNLPYTMTPAMVADAVLGFKPRILYPYHYGETDPEQIKTLLKDAPDIQVNIRDMK